MKKCHRVKNPCKICLQSVNHKTGLQCKGACRKWAHYTCLKFSPEKIKEIKAGIIKLTCPCPNCNIQNTPKELVIEPPLECDLFNCPANPLAKFTAPPQQHCNVTSRGISPSNSRTASSDQTCSVTIFFPDSCKSSYQQTIKDLPLHLSVPPCTKPEVSYDCKPTNQKQMAAALPTDPCPFVDISSAKPRNTVSPATGTDCQHIDISPMTNSPNYVKDCQPGCLHATNVNPHSVDIKDAPPINECANKKRDSLSKSLSCSCIDVNITDNKKCDRRDGLVKDDGKDFKITCSDSKLTTSKLMANQKVLLSTIHELCNTVGNLTNQIKELMCRMIVSVDKKATVK